MEQWTSPSLLEKNLEFIAGLERPKRRHHWPHFRELSLDQDEMGARLLGVGGSDANVILSGDSKKLRSLWEEKRCLRPSEDLSDVLAVNLGNWTEAFNRQWYEKVSGNAITRIRESSVCFNDAWRRCTIDGFVHELGAVWEAKHTNAFSSLDDILERFMPQLQHNMAVLKAERAVLSVIFGNHKYEIIEVASDWLYQQDLLTAERQFWDCVIRGTEPVPVEPPPTPRPLGTREVCFEGNNAWASAAFDWLENRLAAKTHANASAQIKQLIDEDVTRAFGHGIEAKRSRAGAITIREFV
ncbi:YqaJ viral recombinase family protein [Sphingomonas hankyongi]|uniref:YqaJ viral recombinase family protein n=1 Tax=Sphingomonas hankyongi TaxID=2908209 RepID=A0ABT0S2Q4_9SPHN|nr:YqaJ viral recombinase family protein [Sphingomonas hankyongi]MCL6730133.1 YqaJ viral recombinase family protein [Sphingomonas hankyongi]